MDSNQFSYSYNTQEYTLPEEQQINYDFPQTQNYESIQEITTSPQEYQKISYQTYEQSNVIDSYNNYDTSNQLNTYDTTNNYEQYTNVSDINGISQTYTPENYDITNINDYNTDYQQSTNYQIDNNITYEDNNINSNYNIENIDYGNNNATLYNEYEYNGQTSLINVENPIYEQNIDYTTQTEIISPPINNYESAQIEENQNISVTPEPQVNQNIENIPNPNQISTSLENQQTSAVNQLSNQDNDSKRGSSPKLVNPLETNEPQTFPAPDIQSMRSDKEPEKEPENINLAQKEEEKEKEINNNNLTKDELNLLKTAKIGSKRKYDIKSHLDLTLVKEDNEFYYDKIHKVSTFLLGHYEMPDNLVYKSPILSNNSKYLACIGKGDEDSVFVWEVSDLYWYKYKFSYSKVDSIIFTPDSKGIIIVYENTNPIMYDLSNGKTKLEFEKFEQQNGIQNSRCFYAYDGSFFILTTSKSFTLWSLSSGKIKQNIFDESPIKTISNNHLILIDSNLNCIIKKINDQTILESLKLKGVESYNDILEVKCTKDMNNLIYVIKHGIIVYNLKTKEFNGLQKFECSVDKAVLSDDGKYIMKTNMKNLCVYDLEKGTAISTILKDKFKECEVFFNCKKMIIIDNISIIIQDIFNEKAPEKYIWLNKNPTKFEEVKFSSDFKILLARLNRNEAIAYDLKSGYILKKWQNLDENWLTYTLTTFGGEKVAVKTSLFMIKIWNYRTKKEEATFYGYNSNSLCFSSDADYLACGAQNGSEIARVWDIYEQKYGVYKYNGTNNNYHTVVHLTSPEPVRLICCAVDQPPLIFDSFTKELLIKCECPYRFEEIYEIQSELMFDIFLVKGRDNQKRNIGIMYKISDGTLLETYENYTVLELARFEGILICKCDNVNGGKLTSTDIKNLEEPLLSDFQIQSDKCKLLSDHKTAVIEYGDEYSKEFVLINIKNGNVIGKINFVKNNERNSESYITADPLTNELYFRYFEILTAEETMVHLKKNLFNVEEESK